MTKKFRPTTPGLRHLVLPSNSQVTTGGITGKQKIKPEKSLLSIKKRTGGRNNHGRITCRHIGGGHKQFYRQVDFRRYDKNGIPAKVASIEYDPNRTAHIALLHYVDGEKRYIIAPGTLKVGDTVESGEKAPFKPGCCMRLKDMPQGSVIHNLELVPERGAKLVRSAGMSAQLLGKSEGYATVKMPSGEFRMINEKCYATFGEVSNAERVLRSEGKAGRVRWQGVRPTVRGTAMNPVDHPHGGGEGKHNGYIPQTPWAMQTKGYRTRNKKKVSSRFIVKDRRK